MEKADALWQFLKEEYGITTMEELDEALKTLGEFDISMFCKAPGRKGRSCTENELRGTANNTI